MRRWLSKDYKQETTSQQKINFLPVQRRKQPGLRPAHDMSHS